MALRRRVLSCVLVVLTFLGFGLLGLDSYFCSDVKTVAHRGFGVVGKNKLSAFENSARFDAVECDIWFTTDAEAVVSHYDEVVTTSGEKLKISENSLEILKQKAKDLVTVEDFLKVCNKNNVMAVIDIKSWSLSPFMVESLRADITELFDVSRTILLSYEKEVARTIKSIGAEVHFVFDSEPKVNVEFCIKNQVNACAKHTIIDKEMVKVVHDAGLKINAWTVNDTFSRIRLGSLGVDYITSDILW